LSQIYKTSTGGGSGPINTLTPDQGGAVSPVGNNINVLTTGSSSVQSQDFANGIRTINGGAGELDVRLTNRLQGTGSTVGATTADIITFSLGATPGAYKFFFNLVGFEATTPMAGGYDIDSSARTTGAAATIISVPDADEDEDVAFVPANWDVIASGNNVILRVTGIAGFTIDWSAVGYYVFVS